MYNDDGKPEDIVPEHVAVRRGMRYQKDRHGKVCFAEDESPFLIDRLYNHEVIHADHHFYGVQCLTMRKLFTSPVGVKVGMLRVRRDGDEAEDKPIPMEDTDYLKVLRGVRNPTGQRLIREICDEAADPGMHPMYARQAHAVRAAFDALCDAVRTLWEQKREQADRVKAASESPCAK